MDGLIEQGVSDREPLPAITYELEQLLEQMTVESFPEVVEIEPAIGREIW
jgi:hypothetical protein